MGSVESVVGMCRGGIKENDKGGEFMYGIF
jgi:hypothetical protein